MSNARDIMHVEAICVQESETLETAARRMHELDVGALPICGADDRLHGIITDRDIVVKCLVERKDPKTTTAGELALVLTAEHHLTMHIFDAAATGAMRAICQRQDSSPDPSLDGVSCNDSACAIRARKPAGAGLPVTGADGRRVRRTVRENKPVHRRSLPGPSVSTRPLPPEGCSL